MLEIVRRIDIWLPFAVPVFEAPAIFAGSWPPPHQFRNRLWCTDHALG